MNPTASKLPLLERCPAAGALDAVWAETTDDQRAGSERHRYIQRAREIGRAEALAAIPADAPWREQCEAIDVDAIPAGQHELAYAYDVETDTVRCLGPWIDRAYDAGPTEVTGTLDLVSPPTAERGRWLVVDFKGVEEVDAAAVNLQLGFYALCVAREHQLDEVDVAIVYLEPGGRMRWDTATLGMFDLEGIADRVRGVARAVAAARAAGPHDYTTGYHCRRCPALVSCPAQTRAALALATDTADVSALARMSAEDAGRAWVKVKVLGELLDQVRAALSARAEVAGGLPLPDGERLVPVPQTRRALVLDKALPVLRERFGEQADAAVDRSLDAGVVARLARQLAPGKGQKKAETEVWEALGAAGAVRTTTHVQFRVKKAKASAAEGEES